MNFRLLKYFFTKSKIERGVLHKLKKMKFHIEEPPNAFKAETERIVQQIFFPAEQQEEKIELKKKINNDRVTTVAELLEQYVPFSSSFEYTRWFNQLVYCITFQPQIQQQEKKQRQYVQGIYRQKYDETIQVVEKVFLTTDQILNNETFQKVINDFTKIASVEEMISLRRKLYKILGLLFELDYQILKQSNLNQNPLNFLGYIGQLRLNMNEQNELCKAITEYKCDLDFALRELSLLHLKRVDHTQNLAQFINVYNQQRDLTLIDKLDDAIDHIIEQLPHINGDQSIQIMSGLLRLKLGSKEIYDALLWNMLRYDISSDKILPLLLYFRQKVIYINRQITNQSIFQELYPRQISGYKSLAMALNICFNNDIIPSAVLCTDLFNCKEAVLLNHANINNIYIGTESRSLGLKKQVSNLLNLQVKSFQKGEVVGYFQVNETKSTEDNTTYLKYNSELLEDTVKLIWCSFVQGITNHEDINLSIQKVNQLIDEKPLKLSKQTLRLLVQINRMISKDTRKMFPNKLKMILGKQNIQIKGDVYPHPRKLATIIFNKEKSYFIHKYKDHIKYDVVIDDVYYDIVVEGEEKKAQLQFHNTNEYIGDVELFSVENARSINQDESVIEVTYQDIMSTREIYLESLLKDILPEAVESTQHRDELITLKSNIIVGEQKLQENLAEEESSESVYELSD